MYKILVSIPQAVSTVATVICWKLLRALITKVSIPQAVSTVATEEFLHNIVNMLYVSIPQAVSTVATAGSKKPVFKRFQKVVLENLKP